MGPSKSKEATRPKEVAELDLDVALQPVGTPFDQGRFNTCGLWALAQAVSQILQYRFMFSIKTRELAAALNAINMKNKEGRSILTSGTDMTTLVNRINERTRNDEMMVQVRDILTGEVEQCRFTIDFRTLSDPAKLQAAVTRYITNLSDPEAAGPPLLGTVVACSYKHTKYHFMRARNLLENGVLCRNSWGSEKEYPVVHFIDRDHDGSEYLVNGSDYSFLEAYILDLRVDLFRSGGDYDSWHSRDPIRELDNADAEAPSLALNVLQERYGLKPKNHATTITAGAEHTSHGAGFIETNALAYDVDLPNLKAVDVATVEIIGTGDNDGETWKLGAKLGERLKVQFVIKNGNHSQVLLKGHFWTSVNPGTTYEFALLDRLFGEQKIRLVKDITDYNGYNSMKIYDCGTSLPTAMALVFAAKEDLKRKWADDFMHPNADESFCLFYAVWMIRGLGVLDELKPRASSLWTEAQMQEVMDKVRAL